MKAKRPICPRCESGTVYVRKDMSLVCRRCGYDSRREVYTLPSSSELGEL